MAFVLLRTQQRAVPATATARAAAGLDRWLQFNILTSIAVVRSITFFGMNTFIALYWIRYLGASPQVGGLALTGYFAGGVLGTLVGGRLGDRYGVVRTIQIGTLAAAPCLCASIAVLIKLGQDYLPSRPAPRQE